MIVIIYIIVVLTGACSSQQSHTFTTSITQLGLSSDRYFDAAVGARVTGSPSNSLNCEEGNHCITPWWSVVGASNLSESNLTTSSSNLEQVGIICGLFFTSPPFTKHSSSALGFQSEYVCVFYVYPEKV